MKRLIIVFLLLGFVSLFADIAYEGARSVLGAYIEILKGTAIVAGVIGLGEFIGYIMRFISGLIATKMRSSTTLWILTISGYALNSIAIPSLALVNRWDLVLLLVFLERVGKGIRTPSRDVILSDVVESIGRGKGFGIHELLDQIGAITGPLLVSIVLMYRHSYGFAFSVLGIPAFMAVVLVIIVSRIHPRIRGIDRGTPRATLYGEILKNRRLLMFIIVMSIAILGFVHWSIASYHLKHFEVISDEEIGFMYMIAMVVDALLAVPLGDLYDRYGVKILMLIPIVMCTASLSLFTISRFGVLIGSILWGVSMAILEVIPRAVIADIVSIEYRALAYGVYSLALGLAWGIGGVIVSTIYQLIGIYMVFLYIVSIEIIAFISLYKFVEYS